jgi:ribosome biogenesis GTPase
LCINKCDLGQSQEEEQVKAIYEPAGYTVLCVSAITGKGIEELVKLLAGKVAVLIGPSGVGKSSIINLLDPDLKLRTGTMDRDSGVGKSTTTYSELFPIKMETQVASSWVADTPGFSLSELKHPLPCEVAWQFPEIANLAQSCKYQDCMHLVEDGCNVLANLGKIANSRYESYQTIVTESIQEYKLQRDTSQKVEAQTKTVGSKRGKAKIIPRLDRRYREASRKSVKQELLGVATEDDPNSDS